MVDECVKFVGGLGKMVNEASVWILRNVLLIALGANSMAVK